MYALALAFSLYSPPSPVAPSPRTVAGAYATLLLPFSSTHSDTALNVYPLPEYSIPSLPNVFHVTPSSLYSQLSTFTSLCVTLTFCSCSFPKKLTLTVYSPTLSNATNKSVPLPPSYIRLPPSQVSSVNSSVLSAPPFTPSYLTTILSILLLSKPSPTQYFPSAFNVTSMLFTLPAAIE